MEKGAQKINTGRTHGPKNANKKLGSPDQVPKRCHHKCGMLRWISKWISMWIYFRRDLLHKKIHAKIHRKIHAHFLAQRRCHMKVRYWGEESDAKHLRARALRLQSPNVMQGGK